MRAALCFATAVAAALLTWGCASEDNSPASAPRNVNSAPGGRQAVAGSRSPVANPEQIAALRDQWGIEITSLQLSSHGYMLDFRYKVLDPDKAGTLAARKNKPCLIDQATGAILRVPDTPKMGPLRQSAARLKAGKIYFALFSNSRGIVKSGSKVTVAIGDFRAENLIVQ